MTRRRGRGHGLWGRRFTDRCPHSVWVYVLRDPRTLEVRYVGRTKDMSRRRSAHMNSPLYELATWIADLRVLDLDPVMLPVWLVEQGEDSGLAERNWFAHFTQAGHRLLNFASHPMALRGKRPGPMTARRHREMALARLDKLAASLRTSRDDVIARLRVKPLDQVRTPRR